MWGNDNKNKKENENKNKRKKKMAKKSDGKIDTIIGEGTDLTGDIKQEGSIVIYGKVEGKIDTEGTITVGHSGLVVGNLTGDEVKVAGRVNGNIIAKSKMILEDTSHLLGDVQAEQIIIEDGAKFEGKCDMNLSKSEKEKLEADTEDESKIGEESNLKSKLTPDKTDDEE